MPFLSGLTGWKKRGDGWRHRRRPIIGVAVPNRGSWPAWVCIRLLVRLSGGKAVRITPSRPNPRYELDGLILSGGADIHPERYKEKLVQTIKIESSLLRRWNKRMILSVFIWIFRKLFSVKTPVGPNESKMRDALEFSLLEEAVKKCQPVLGICRGAQLINVFFGGSLFQDIKPFYIEQPELHTALPRQRVFIDHDSLLYKIFGKSFIQVNSLHFQSVNHLGKGLKITAKDANGIVEGVEHTQCPFVIGVQWHPEFLLFHESQRRLFKALISRARAALDDRPALL
jgi:putative glutamine amidotransferase